MAAMGVLARKLCPSFAPFFICCRPEEKTEEVKEDVVNEVVPESKEEAPSMKLPKKRGVSLHLGTDNGLGRITFTLRYDVRREILKVHIIQGRDLAAMDPRGTSDPYVIIGFKPIRYAGTVYKTSIKMKTLKPKWNETFVFKNFKNEDLKTTSLHLLLMDWDKSGDHDPLGELYFPLIKMYKKLPGEKAKKTTSSIDSFSHHDSASYFDEFSCSDAMETRSMVSTRITEHDPRARSADDVLSKRSMMSANSREVQSEDALLRPLSRKIYDATSVYSHASSPSLVSYLESEGDEVERPFAIRRLEIQKFLTPPPNARKPFGEILLAFGYFPKHNRMIIKVIKGRYIRDPDGFTLNPYVTITLRVMGEKKEKTLQTVRTSVRSHVDHPVWNESFEFKVMPKTLKSLAADIQILSVDSHSRLLGQLRIGLKAYPTQREHYEKMLNNIGRFSEQWHLVRH